MNNTRHGGWSRALVLVLALLPAVARAQSEGPLSLRPNWRAGEERNYEMVKTRVKADGMKVAARVTVRTDVRVQVLEAGDDGYLLEWKLGETRLDDPALAADPMLSQTINMVRGLVLQTEVDVDGAFRELRDWQRVRTQLLGLTEEMIRRLGKERGTEEQATRAMAQVEAMLSSEQHFAQLVMRELLYLLVPLGHTYDLGVSTEYETQLPNIFGGDPLPGRVRFEWKSVDQGQAVIAWSQSADPDALTSAVRKAMESMSPGAGKDLPAMERLRVSDEAEFVVDPSSGWTTAYTFTRRVVTGSKWQTETLSMKKQ